MATILIVDDDNCIRDVVRTMLEAEGYRVLEAANGSDASQIYHTEAVDLILTDIFMPDGDGIELIRELRCRHRDARMIAMSGGTTRVPLDFFPIVRMLGAKVLQKPFSRTQLLKIVAETMLRPAVHSSRPS